MVYQANDCRGPHTYEHITKSQGNEIRRNETHLNFVSGLGQGTIKNSRGSQFQDFLNTRGVRADKELACQLRSSFPKKMASILPLHTRQGSTLSLCSVSRARQASSRKYVVFNCICVTHSQEIRRNETHLNLGSGLGQWTIKNFRGSQFQDFLNTRGVRADKELACQLLSPFKKRWHQSYVPKWANGKLRPHQMQWPHKNANVSQ